MVQLWLWAVFFISVALNIQIKLKCHVNEPSPCSSVVCMAHMIHCQVLKSVWVHVFCQKLDAFNTPVISRQLCCLFYQLVFLHYCAKDSLQTAEECIERSEIWHTRYVSFSHLTYFFKHYQINCMKQLRIVKWCCKCGIQFHPLLNILHRRITRFVPLPPPPKKNWITFKYCSWWGRI